ncbi:hypothetical protein CCP3SC15_450016 [Gammaproteobacteria bacterium]
MSGYDNFALCPKCQARFYVAGEPCKQCGYNSKNNNYILYWVIGIILVLSFISAFFPKSSSSSTPTAQLIPTSTIISRYYDPHANDSATARAQMTQDAWIEPTVYSGYKVCAKVNINIHKAPNPTAEIVGHILKGECDYALEISPDGRWLQIDPTHWITSDNALLDYDFEIYQTQSAQLIALSPTRKPVATAPLPTPKLIIKQPTLRPT